MTAQWEPGKLYAPGDIVQPRITDPVTQDTLNNPTFESGDTGWGTGGAWDITNTGSAAFAGSWKAVFNDSKLLANTNADDDDNVARSFDGISWTHDDIDPGVFFSGSGALNENCASIGKWIITHLVVGFAHESSDGGVTWTQITPVGGPSGGIRSCNWIPELGKAFIGMSGEVSRYSTDLTNWTAGDTTFQSATAGFAYSAPDDILVFAGTDSIGNDAFWSDDGGDTWTASDCSISLSSVVYCSGLDLFVAPEAGGGTDVARSANGKNWSVAAGVLPASHFGGYVAYSPSLGANGRIVNVANTPANRIAWSDDGITWTAATAPSLNYRGVVWDSRNSQFVACSDSGNNSSFATSPDGQTWTERTTSYTGVGGFNDIGFGSRKILSANETMENTARLTVSPGQFISASAKCAMPGQGTGMIGIAWHGAADVLLSITYSDVLLVPGNASYRTISVSGVAPENALTCSVVLRVTGTADEVTFDNVNIAHVDPVTISQFLFKAVQTDPGYSDSDEPVWPTVLGNTVVDNEVTWEAINANRVVWRAFPILQSGASEPTWPTTVDGEVADNTISWQAQTRRVEDENCPNSKEVVIAAAKIFAGDDDIISFSATVNPLDWTTTNDAGFIPFGMNPYGDEPISALALYRSNVVGFSSKGFQMWQVDADPANFAILDAVPVGCPYHLSPQPVSNDLVFLTEVGIRSMGIAGASTNLQAGTFGKQIDPLVKAAIDALGADEDPIGINFPGAGQYWLIFGSEAFVLTMNGGKEDMSWSRYTFPTDITDWTIQNKTLYLRSGDEVWEFSADAKLDRETAPSTGTNFTGEIRWQYLDFGGLGDQKMMHGFDLVGSGACTITFGYDQSDDTKVTANWTVSDIDTLPGTMIPMPISGPSFQMRLLFSADQAWEWQASAIYLDDQRTTA